MSTNKKNSTANTTTAESADERKVQAAVTEIKRLLSAICKQDLANKYIVGQKVQEIRTSAHDEKYGKRIVARIAREVGVTAMCLYQYADVAKTWNRGTFDEAGLRAAKARVTFSHFIELAHPDHAAEREARLERAIAEGLSVRKLRALRTPAKAHAQKPHAKDVLERLEIEGPSTDLKAVIDQEIQAQRLVLGALEERIHKLESAQAQLAAASDEKSMNDESRTYSEKAAE